MSFKNTSERVQDPGLPLPPEGPSPDIHLMGAKAEVGVKNKAGSQVIVLTQFSGCHSVRPHGALKTMLFLTQNRAQGCATQLLSEMSVEPTACLSVGQHGVGVGVSSANVTELRKNDTQQVLSTARKPHKKQSLVH